MDGRRSLEITAPAMPAVPPPSQPRPSRAIDSRGTRRTMMRVMQRKSVGMVAVYEQDPPVGGKRELVFESPTFNVHISNYPAEWQRLTDDELSKLRRLEGDR
ncbi:MAG TPA: hypothetical protein VF483_03300 [Gemmatimonadaceae bacterium]